MMTASDWIEKLKLLPHPEGGWYRESYRSAEQISKAALPERFTGNRCFSTAIYYLLEGNDFSALHRIHQDEIWHFYDGVPLLLHLINPEGGYRSILLGRNPARGEEPQAIAPRGWLFGASVSDPSSYCLVGCTVAPGFQFEDFEMPSRAELVKQYPALQDLILKLTR